ncbi:1833_t:CDS:2 [Ambispora leptoticha]|uniref:1833_t:CDS:1 n=1 Tax=Ambispora leptoticha TaxID=144679 RepID=A0A9N9B060_9GLOM|nr:1833_t:CDS:2 [Ambispora leptoticha]
MSLESEVATLNTPRMSLEREVTTHNTQEMSLEIEAVALNTQRMSLEKELTTLKTQKASLEREMNTLLQKLENSENTNVMLREKLDRVQSDNKTLTDENTLIRKKITTLQQEITNQHNAISRIELELYQQGQEVDRLKKENVGFLKNTREVERKLREETLTFEKERQTWQEREGELNSRIKALQDTNSLLAQQGRDSINSSSSSDSLSKKHSHQSSSNGMMPTSSTSGFLNSMFSPSYHAFSSLSARLSNRHSTDGTITRENSPPSPTTNLHNATREIKIAKSTIKEQDRFINRLKNEIEQTKTATTDQININKSQALRIALLETELEQVKRVKRSLEDVNEGFQLLLHEKTMKGDFMLNPIMQHHEANNSRQKLIDSLKESPTNDDNNTNRTGASIKREKKSRPKSLVTDLAAELERASAGNINNTPLGERVEKESDQIVDAERVEIERRKTLSGPFRLPSNIKIPRSPTIQNIEEKADQLSPLPTPSPVHSRTTSLSEDVSSTKLNSVSATEQQQPIRRTQRRNSSSDGAPRKRWSLWWNNNNNNGKQQTEIKKEDPYMRPMILVQETEKAKE